MKSQQSAGKSHPVNPSQGIFGSGRYAFGVAKLSRRLVGELGFLCQRQSHRRQLGRELLKFAFNFRDDGLLRGTG